jgi:hypothetical protein
MQDESVMVAEALMSDAQGLRRGLYPSARSLARREFLGGSSGRPAEVARQEVLRIGPGAEWFQREDGEVVELKTRRSLRRILAHLVKMHQKGAEARTVRQLQAAGWPGERMLPKSGADRVYTAIRTLRRFGLEGILITRNGGYLLSPACALRCEE